VIQKQLQQHRQKKSFEFNNHCHFEKLSDEKSFCNNNLLKDFSLRPK